MRSRLPWAAFAAAALGIVLGFVMGGVGPRLEVASQGERIAALEEDLAAADRGGWRSPVPGLDRILRAPPSERDQGRPLPPADELAEANDRAEQPDVSELEPSALAGDAGVGSIAVRERWGERQEQRSTAERLEAFSRAASIQEVRRLQSRAALQEQAGLDDVEVAAVDEALAEMNQELSGYGGELVLFAMGDEPPPARDLLSLTHDVTGILHRAQVRLEGVLGPERAATIDPGALEIWNHVDLRQLEPAARDAARALR